MSKIKTYELPFKLPNNLRFRKDQGKIKLGRK